MVVDNPKTWRLKLPDVPVVAARTYLTDPTFSELRNVKVFNLCKSYAYQSDGYYVSLLAMARRHKPLPSITTIQDLKTLSITRVVAEDMAGQIQRSLRRLKSSNFVLSIYFGRNLAHRYDDLSQSLFRLFPVPLLSAEFERREGVWRLDCLKPMAAGEIPLGHVDFVEQSAQTFFARKRMPSSRRATPAPYDLAILHNPKEVYAPSNKQALRNFELAAKRVGIGVEYIEKEDYGRIPEFDALWIRETTAVNHHTYRFARRATAEGMVVIDDPESIVKCTNKVYLAELLTCNRVPTPRTLIAHEDNQKDVATQIGFPCILKQPDSSFSQGVVKVSNASELEAAFEKLLKESDLILAQEFVPTDFDWRIGVLDRKPLYACKYHMVKQHWQITKNGSDGPTYGDVQAFALDDVPEVVMDAALRAARLIGDGLYGVDVKYINNQPYIIEVNDNPTIMAGYEDAVSGGQLYERLVDTFLKRILARKNATRSTPDAERALAIV